MILLSGDAWASLDSAVVLLANPFSSFECSPCDFLVAASSVVLPENSFGSFDDRFFDFLGFACSVVLAGACCEGSTAAAIDSVLLLFPRSRAGFVANCLFHSFSKSSALTLLLGVGSPSDLFRFFDFDLESAKACSCVFCTSDLMGLVGLSVLC